MNLSEEEFEQQFLTIDTDKVSGFSLTLYGQDGKISFEDFSEFILNTQDEIEYDRGSYVMLEEESQSPKKVLSAETISAINNLFRDYRSQQKMNTSSSVDLKAIRSYIERNQLSEVPLDAFDTFFKDHLIFIMGQIQSSVISES